MSDFSASPFLFRLLLVAGMVGPMPAFATVYMCTDPATQKKVASQFPCPGETIAEAEARAEAERQANAREQARKDAERNDRQLLHKYPDEATHRRVHVAELQEIALEFRAPTRRFAELAAERKPLDEERKFYVGKPMPPELQRKIDANDAGFAALADIFRKLEARVRHVDARFRSERGHLKKLWAGAPLGSTGLFVPASASRSAT